MSLFRCRKINVTTKNIFVMRKSYSNPQLKYSSLPNCIMALGAQTNRKQSPALIPRLPKSFLKSNLFDPLSNLNTLVKLVSTSSAPTWRFANWEKVSFESIITSKNSNHKKKSGRHRNGLFSCMLYHILADAETKSAWERTYMEDTCIPGTSLSLKGCSYNIQNFPV